MTDFVTCPFTGAGRTDLSATNDSNGNAWVREYVGAVQSQIFNNELEPWSNNIYRCGTAAPQADYSVITDARQDVLDGTSAVYLCARMKTGELTFYRVGIDSNANVVTFSRFNTGTQVDLKTSTVFNPTYQQTYNLEFIVSGSATVTLTLKIDGVTVDSVTDSDASRITTAGYPGFQLYTTSDGSGFFLDNFKGSYSAGGGAVTKGYPFIGGAFARG